ncbi:RagB/SusD family nutrient uptake outer membrane protein [Mucilaginibacter sp. P19]|uniref:RagB/SusD family nutrient uptake outer membrane protein n=1 Tax=Mucilaginibacter sp. P19 TaxID=3423947 RepID=UPI003D67832C
MKSKNITQILCAFGFVLAIAGCKKVLEVGTPQNQLTTDKIFADSTSALAAMANVYALFNNTIDPNYNIYMDCYSDELQYSGSTDETLQYIQGSVAPSNTTNANFWKASYFAIYSANLIIEEAPKATNLTSKTAAQFVCEAKFLRALTYFHLINTYGTVPLILKTDVNLSSKAAQSDSATVYKQIILDLTDAKNGLPATYLGAGKVRANQFAALALLAKVYLWQRDWVNAEATASLVLGSGLYTPLPAITNVFSANSTETILSFWTQFGYIYKSPDLVPSGGAPLYFYTLAQLNSFENGDQRKLNWILPTTVSGTTYYSPYKYRNATANSISPEYLIVLRAGEQYLIRAEARAQQNNISGSISDINVIRHRAGLGDYIGAIDKSSLLSAIYHERRSELFSEWGNRFLDLKRTGTLNLINSSSKSGWKPTGVVLPVPQYEMNTDPNLKQNQGY